MKMQLRKILILTAVDDQTIGIELKFIQSKPFEYPQFGDAFLPWLSIIDVMMFNPLDTIRACISTNYEMI